MHPHESREENAIKAEVASGAFGHVGRKIALQQSDTRAFGVWGEGRVGIRLSPTLAYNGMVDSNPLATFSYLIEQGCP